MKSKLIILGTLLALSFGFQTLPSETIKEKRYLYNSELLFQKPDYYRTVSGYRAKGSAGAIPYAYYEGRVYCLVGREKWGTGKNCYSDFGGSIDVYTYPNIYVETFLQGLVREFTEETGAIYPIRADQVLEEATVISHVNYDRGKYYGYKNVIAFVEVDHIYSKQQLLAATVRKAVEAKSKNKCFSVYLEKDDFQWIDMKEFTTFLFQGNKDSGIFSTLFSGIVEMKFREHFLNTLRSNRTIIESFYLELKGVVENPSRDQLEVGVVNKK